MEHSIRETTDNGIFGGPSTSMSSPPRRQPPRREKRNSSITPRRFSRFFRLPCSPATFNLHSSPGSRLHHPTFSSSPTRPSPFVVSPGSSPFHDTNVNNLNRLRPLPRRRLFTDIPVSPLENGEDDGLPPRKRVCTPTLAMSTQPEIFDENSHSMSFPRLASSLKNTKAPKQKAVPSSVCC